MSCSPPKIYVGTSGWSYGDWQGVVYPPDAGSGFDRLAYLARFVDAVEVNTSFYGPPRPEYVRDWLRRTAFKPDFLFTFKLWRRFTHETGSDWSLEEVEQYRAGLEPAVEEGRLGAVLVQFPWSFRFTPSNLERLAAIAETFAGLPLVVEVRHVTWAGDEPSAALRRLNVSFCNIDQPGSRSGIPAGAIVTGPVGYVRLHGRNREAWFDPSADRDRRYDYLYSEQELAEWLPRIERLLRETRKVFVFTNNHFRGQAVVNALQIISRLRGTPVAVPEPLLEAYPVLERIAGRPPSPRRRGGQGRLF